MDTKDFEKNGFKIVKKLIEPVSFLAHCQDLEKSKKLTESKELPGSQSLYNDPFFYNYMLDLLPEIEEHTGTKLNKSYCFIHSYSEGNMIKSHYDRPSCEISVLISLGHSNKPWPFGIMDRIEHPHSIILEPGDALIYKGTELAHWRERNTTGSCWQLFLHYVETNGPYIMNSHKKQTRFTIKFFNRIFDLFITRNNK